MKIVVRNFFDGAKFEEAKHPRGERGRFGAGSTYHGPDGKALPAAAQARLSALKVPPGWANIKLFPEGSDLQVTGTDSKGRKVYRYAVAFSEKRAAEKFARLKAFNTALPSIRARIQKDRATNDAAAVLALIDHTGFRVGSDRETGAEKQAYGASTLRGEHVTLGQGSATFAFTGKKGVSITKTITDPALVKDVAARKAKGGRLFNTSDIAVRDYLHSISTGFKVKDFRTWNGTNVALAEVARRETPKGAKALEAARKDVAKVVAAHLGNTPAIALAAYIDPGVWSKWKAEQ